jgi:HD domain
MLDVTLNPPPRALTPWSAPLSRAEVRAELIVVTGLIAAVAALFLAFPDARAADPLLVLLSIGLLTLTQGARIDIPGGWTAPIELVVVPVLFLLPAWLVPVAVAAALALARVPDVIQGRAVWSRLLLSPGNAWFSVGPAAVLAAAGNPSAPDVGVVVLVAMLFAQISTDFLVMSLWHRMTRGATLSEQISEVGMVYAIDVALAPVGLLAALALDESHWFLVLMVPLFGVLAVFARERRRRLEQLTELNDAYRGTAMALAEVVDADDAYTGMHTRDVVELVLAVADRLGLDERRRRLAEFGALLHDVGKVAIPHEIINKPGPLEPHEWAVMHTHTVAGQRVLDRAGGFLGEVGVVVRASHERWDGSGYPDGLARERIPLEARIISACDAYNAMTTTRPYREAMPAAAAVAELRACAGSQFDPAVVEALLAVLRVPVDAPAPLATPA